MPKDNSVKLLYDTGFGVNHIFLKSSSGVQTELDELSIHSNKTQAEQVLEELKNLDIVNFAQKYNFQNKLSKIENAINDVKNNNSQILEIDYKVFNTKYCIYTGKTNGLMGRPRFEMMKNIIHKDNISICLLRSLIDTTIFSSVFCLKI